MGERDKESTIILTHPVVDETFHYTTSRKIAEALADELRKLNYEVSTVSVHKWRGWIAGE